MAEIISLLILLIGIIGMAVIALRKIPILANLPLENGKGFWPALISQLKEKIFKDFSFELLLHKLLSKIRILALRTENKISHWLLELRQKKIEKKNNFSEDYWDKLKK
jgi:hypothetical protein